MANTTIVIDGKPRRFEQSDAQIVSLRSEVLDIRKQLEQLIAAIKT